MTSLSTELVTGDGRVLSIADIARLYRQGVNLSTPTSGKIQKLGETEFSIRVNFKTIDCDNLEKINTFKVYSLTTKAIDNSIRGIGFVRCVSDAHEYSELVCATSENGRFLARLKTPVTTKKVGPLDASKRQLLEIWDRSRLLKTIDVSESDYHGLICTDPQFSSFVWSPFGDQDKLLYVCNAKRPKASSYFKEPAKELKFDDKNADEADKKKHKEETGLGDEFLKREDWGECLTGIEHTIVAVLDVANDCQVSTIEEEGFSLADAAWLDRGTKVVSVGYKENPRRLGLIYYNSREGNIFVHDWQSSSPHKVLELSSDSQSYRNPRVNHAGDKFLYTTVRSKGPHRRAEKLNIFDLKTRIQTTLRDNLTGEEEYFITTIPKNCFTTDDDQIVFGRMDHLFQHLCRYDLKNSTVSKIKFPTTGVTLLDLCNNIILAEGSEVNATPTIFVAYLNPPCANEVVAWHQLEDCIHLDEVDYQPYKIPTEDGTSFVSALFIGPNLEALHRNFPNRVSYESVANRPTNLPTLVAVHGGPHSSYALYYMSTYIFYVRLGLKVLLINYRGSTGVSDDYVKQLIGNIGQIDVSDCLQTVRYFVQNGLIDPSKLIIQGGSHGGFLACHLSCQDEYKFLSAIIRNPVVDMTSMHMTTDIPDWCYTEGLGHEKYDPTWIPGPNELSRLFDRSPISKHLKCNVPTVMLLGDLDRRVNMYQGERWINLLKARGVETICKVYPDKHSLDKPDADADSNLTAATFILRHLPKYN